MFLNSNYSAKLSPTMKENWIVQIFKNTKAVSATNTDDTPDLAFCFAAASGSTSAKCNNIDYYPAIINKPNVSYGLNLKSFTTSTGAVSLNIANVDIGGTSLLETLGNKYINGQVNILSQIDDDNTVGNALQIFSGRVSAFSYKNNIIVMSIISNRPFQDVSIPQTRSTGVGSQKFQPVVFGDYTANDTSSFSTSTSVFEVPFLKNAGNLFYMLPNASNTSGSNKLEYYDKNSQRFYVLTNSTTSEATIDGVNTLNVPKEMVRTYNILPDDLQNVAGASNSAYISTTTGTGTITQSGTFTNAYNGNNANGVTYTNTNGLAEDGQTAFVTFRIKIPQQTGKVSALKMSLDGNIQMVYDDTDYEALTGIFVNINKTVSSNAANTTSDVELIGTASTGQNTTGSQNLASLVNDVVVTSLLDDGQMPDDFYLTFNFRKGTSDSAALVTAFNFNLDNITFEITMTNESSGEPIASTTFNAGVDKLYLGNDTSTSTFTGHSATNDTSRNPVAIHRELLKQFLDIDLGSDNLNVYSGYKGVAELRDSTNTGSNRTAEWSARFAMYDQESLESSLKKLQYEGCFFFEFNPQAQQSDQNISSIRYFTIADTPGVSANLSQVDISDYAIGMTPVNDLETNLKVNYEPHPAEKRHLQTATYELEDSSDGASEGNHDVIFDSAKHQLKEISLDYLHGSVSEVTGANGKRNSSWVNFRKSLFGEYKTTMSATIINPEKYGMLQIGDILDFGDTLFGNLGTPFDEISDTFDSLVAMPTRLFSEQWTDKKFIITNLKRSIGKVQVQCRET